MCMYIIFQRARYFPAHNCIKYQYIKFNPNQNSLIKEKQGGLFHDVCKSEHYIVHLKTIQRCVSIMSQENLKKRTKKILK